MTACLMLLTSAPFGLTGQPEVQAALAVASVYFWSVFRPAAMAPVVVFLLGLLADLLGYAPAGVSVLALLLVHGTAMWWRRVLVRQGFLLVWLSFAVISALAAAVGWALTSLLVFRVLPPDPGVFQAALAAGMYPALATVLGWIHRSLAEPGEA